ncbi:MAG: AAA family ATPase [Clostridia bacterium]|nr:AAA family ATPase [Clostridia bacterium]
MDNKEFKQEKEYLAKTIGAIDGKIYELNDNVQKQKEWALELKKQYIRDLREYDQYEFADNYNKLNEIMDFTDEQIAQINRLKDIREKPYFGRVDFKVFGEEEKLKLYIGLMSITDKNGLYVVDWRAPVSELFYESGKGMASYEAPDGTVEGEITLKRQYDIENSTLLEYYDVDVNLFDEYLQKVLAKTKGDKLQNIASTIQEEQNKIIRNLKDDVLVVQGYAGCGKTTIALHHIAYALYRLKNLKSSSVLFFSPNEAFLTYIGKVLPDLGEENTRNATFPKFIKRLLKTNTPVESSDEFVNRYTFLKDKKQIDEKLKFSMREKMQKWLEERGKNLSFVCDVVVEDKTYEKEKLNEMLQNDFKHAKYREKLFMVCEYIYKQTKSEDMGKKEFILNEITQSVNQKCRLFELYDDFLTDFGYQKLDIDNPIYFEDAVLLCVLKELTQNIIIRMDIKHVVLDEAQDYPLLFIDFLLRIYRHASFSIFGDINQKTVPGELDSLKDITTLELAQNRFSFVELDKTYRSSEEIVEYSSSLVGNPRHNAFRLKNGEPVLEQQLEKTLTGIKKQLENILEKVDYKKNSVGIITGDTQTAKEVFEILAQNKTEQEISLIKNAYSVAGTNIQVVPISLSKGLEFDTVVLIEKGKLFEHSGKNKFLYIGATRAINRLFVLKK